MCTGHTVIRTYKVLFVGDFKHSTGDFKHSTSSSSGSTIIQHNIQQYYHKKQHTVHVQYKTTYGACTIQDNIQ